MPVENYRTNRGSSTLEEANRSQPLGLTTPAPLAGCLLQPLNHSTTQPLFVSRTLQSRFTTKNLLDVGATSANVCSKQTHGFAELFFSVRTSSSRVLEVFTPLGGALSKPWSQVSAHCLPRPPRPPHPLSLYKEERNVLEEEMRR